MLLEDLFNTYEELKQYIFIINRGNQKPIVISFRNDNFYHLVGLHKTNINIYLPKGMTSKDKIYKYMKKHIVKFNNILESEIKEKNTLKLRVKTFHHILDMLKENKNTLLYSLKEHVDGSMYNGDYGLFKVFEQNIYCLFGIKSEIVMDDKITCAPQSWMASDRPNKLIAYKRFIYMESISIISKNMYNDSNIEIFT